MKNLLKVNNMMKKMVELDKEKETLSKEIKKSTPRAQLELGLIYGVMTGIYYWYSKKVKQNEREVEELIREIKEYL